MPLTFAYGSNMDRDAMAARCPASRPLGLARLVGRRPALMREGYLTLVPHPRSVAWGVLWDLALADVPALDRYEEVGRGLYAKRVLPVITALGPRRALVYLGANAGPGVPLPGYLEAVLTAGRGAGLPAAYLRELEAFVPSGPGKVREPPAAAVPRVRPRAAAPSGGLAAARIARP